MYNISVFLYTEKFWEKVIMKKTKIRYLGFLGFIGFAGLVTRNYGLFGFFGFFGFFGPAYKMEDELFEFNLRKSGFNAFMASIIATSVSILLLSLFRTFEMGMILMAIVFALQIFTFTFSLIFYERNN